MQTITDPPEVAQAEAPATAVEEPVIPITRRRVDIFMIWLGVIVTIVLVVAGGLLTWGSNFATDYVHDELAAQNITFPDAESLTGQGREDLLKYADEQVTTGPEAEAYASYIGGHIDGIADGATYSELGGPERAANAAVAEAIESGAPADEIAALEEEAAAITDQRATVFRGEMLRGTLLNTYAWWTIGRIAGIAATAAFVAAAAMFVLVVAGLVHRRRVRH